MPKLYIVPAIGDAVFTQDVKPAQRYEFDCLGVEDYLQQLNVLAEERKRPEVPEIRLKALTEIPAKFLLPPEAKRETPSQRKERKAAEKKAHVEQIRKEAEERLEKQRIEFWKNSKQYSWYDVLAIAAGAITLHTEQEIDLDKLIEASRKSIINWHEYQMKEENIKKSL